MSVFECSLVKTVDDSYEIEIGRALADTMVNELTSGVFGKYKKFAVITDSNVLELYAEDIAKKLQDKGAVAELFSFAAGEKSKTREVKAFIEDSMLACGFRRDCMVVAVGGGVVSDLAGFIAGTFGRGVPFVIYSTTLLSAADASIGGKTAVDTPLATNLIGLFNQPKKVYIDIDTWKTLSQRDISCGLAETVKHALIADESFFDYLEENIEKVFTLDDEVCEHIAHENCRVKYEVVMKDERESSLREILNLGHTVGRAVETVSDYKLLHGEAVAIGLVAASMLSQSLGFVSQEQTDRLRKLLDRAKLPSQIPQYIDKSELTRKLYTDKKVKDGKLRFVLQKGIGDVVYTDAVGAGYAMPISEEQIKAIIEKM